MVSQAANGAIITPSSSFSLALRDNCAPWSAVSQPRVQRGRSSSTRLPSAHGEAGAKRSLNSPFAAMAGLCRHRDWQEGRRRYGRSPSFPARGGATRILLAIRHSAEKTRPCLPQQPAQAASEGGSRACSKFLVGSSVEEGAGNPEKHHAHQPIQKLLARSLCCLSATHHNPHTKPHHN